MNEGKSKISKIYEGKKGTRHRIISNYRVTKVRDCLSLCTIIIMGEMTGGVIDYVLYVLGKGVGGILTRSIKAN